MDNQLYEMLAGAGLETILMPKKQFVAEHKKLIKLLRQYNAKPLLKEASEQEAELKSQMRKSGGGKKDTKKWIQAVVSSPSFKEGAFTRQAKSHKMTPQQFAKEVVAHPDKYTTTTRRRAQFVLNVKRGGSGEGLKELEVMDEDDEINWKQEERIKLRPWAIYKGKTIYRNYYNHLFRKDKDGDAEWYGFLQQDDENDPLTFTVRIQRPEQVPKFYLEGEVEEEEHYLEAEDTLTKEEEKQWANRAKFKQEEDYKKLSKDELKAIAKERGLKNYQNLKKADLIDKLVW